MFVLGLMILHVYIALVTHPKSTPKLGSAVINLPLSDIAYSMSRVY